MHPSTDAARLDQLVTTMSERLTALTRSLGTWVQDAPRDLQAIEQHVLRTVKELGATLVAGLAALSAPAQPPRSIPCPCGQPAPYQRQRPATVTTLLGPITLPRAYYLCPACRQGQHPLDRQLQICAGSRSAGLDELLALLGATQESFAQAAAVLERLTLIPLSPNTVRDATEALGATLIDQQQQVVAHTLQGHDPPPAATPAPERLYITMDGVLAHLHERGWSEVKVGCCYQTDMRPDRTRPEQLDIRAHSLSYISSLAEAESFGWQMWQEAARRGVLDATEVVVLGDGAHWIWHIADTQFAGATQIVDWYHASSYVWKAASALWGDGHPQREAWARQQLDRLWEGQVAQVLEELARQPDGGAGVSAAVTYFTEHGKRMDYAAYRARGLQIGSGSVESACKQVVSARLKGPGMIWDGAGAEAVAMVRAWQKSGRWEEAMGLRVARTRGYARTQRGAATEAGCAAVRGTGSDAAGAGPGKRVAERGGLPAAVLAQVRAELQQEKGQHTWRKAWSVKRQRAQVGQREAARTARAA